MSQTPPPIRIYIDADACPVKDEVYRVAARHRLPVTVVAVGFIRVPQDPTDRAGGGRRGHRTPPTIGSPSAPARATS